MIEPICDALFVVCSLSYDVCVALIRGVELSLCPLQLETREFSLKLFGVLAIFPMISFKASGL